MKSLWQKLRKVKTALEGTGIETYHYLRPLEKAIGTIVWFEDSEEASQRGDDGKTNQQIHGFVDYFTQTDFDPAVDSIQSALDDAKDVGFFLNLVQYEDGVKAIHFQWDFWVI